MRTYNGHQISSTRNGIVMELIERLKLVDFFRRLEEELTSSKKFRPRYIELTKFMPSNDEDFDKAEEIQEDETLILAETPGDYRVLKREEIEGCEILAVDTTSFRVGETERGIVAAYRAAIVRFDGKEYNVTRLGPFIVHLSDANKEYVYNYLRSVLGLREVSSRDVPKLYKMVDRVRNLIERYLQVTTADYLKDGLILWDGSLTGDTVDTPKEVLVSALNRAIRSNNAVFGISKTSNIRTSDGYRLIDLLSDVYEPAYVKVHHLLKGRLAKRILGEVYAVKFSPQGFTFRVDVYPRRGSSSEEELRRLISTCPMFNGYPEPLRQAHINCYFTGNEVLALQSYVVGKYGLKVVPEFDIRKFILYPF